MVELVTGATGFLGGVLLNELLIKEGLTGKDIRVLVHPKRKCEELQKVGVEIFRGDLLHPSSLKGIMKDVTTVYHNAAIIINESVSYETMMRVNYHGTTELGKEFLKENSSKKFVFASSFGVYGMKFPKYPVSEDYPKKPHNNYQESKYFAEKALFKMSNENGLDITAFRNSLIIGPGDKAITLRMITGLCENKIPYLGKGNKKSSYVDVRDSAHAMILSTKRPISKGRVYNIKSFDVTQKEYFDYHANAYGNCFPTKRYPIWLAYLFAWYKEKTTPKGQESLINRTRVKRFTHTRVLDTTRIQTELQFQPKHSDPKQVIQESIQWLHINNFIKKS